MRIPHNVVGQVRPSKQPIAYVQDAASPGAFGVGVAQSVQGFGESLGKLADELQSQRDELHAFTARKAFIDETSALQQDFHERQQNAPLGAPDFTKDTLKAYEERSKSLLGDLRAKGVPEEELRNLELSLARVRQGYAGQGLRFEAESYATKVGVDITEAGEKLSQIVQTDPYEASAALQAYNETIDAIPNLDAITRQKFRDKGKELFAITAGLSLAEQRPGMVRDMLRPPEPENAEAFAARMKAGIAAVESGHTARPYQAKGPVIKRKIGTDRAYGKYQVMGANIPKWTKQVLGREATIEEFLNTPLLQEAVFKDQMLRLYKKHGNLRDAASVWFTGVPFEQAVKEGRGDGNLSVTEYVSKVENAPGGGPVTGKTGDPVLDSLDGPQRQRVLNAADANFNRVQSSVKAELEIQTENAVAAWMAGGPERYKGLVPTQDQFITAYGSLEGQQRWEEFQGKRRIGGFVQEMGALSETEIVSQVDALEPKDTTSSTFAVEMETFKEAAEAADLVIKQRKDDSAAYVMKNYPAVREAAALAMAENTPEARRRVFAEMVKAYEQLGIPPEDRKAFPAELLNSVKTKMESASPEAKIAELVRMRQEMGDLFYAGLEQMDKSGLHKEAYVAGLVATSTQHQLVAGNALRGVHLYENNKALTPNWSEVNTEFRAVMGQAQLSLPAENVQAINELAAGLYIFNGGDPKEIDPALFDASVRQILGGTAAEGTGIVDLSRGYANIKTILPPNVTSDEFERFVSNATPEVWAEMGGMPFYGNGEIATPEEIAEEGVFVRVGAEDYMVVMGSDGLPLHSGEGEPHIISLTANFVKQVAGGTPPSILDSVFGE